AIDDQTAADNPREVRKTAAGFQTKVVKVLENMMASPDSMEAARARLGRYTASRTAFDDVRKIAQALRATEALAKVDDQLPEQIAKFEGARVAQVAAQLETFRKANPQALSFALTLVARRLKTSWQLVRLATKAAASKSAADVAATPYGIAV